MKVTLSSAMRARDVSRPQPHHETAAQADRAFHHRAFHHRAGRPGDGGW